MNTRNSTSTVTPGDSSEHEDDTTLNEPIPMDTDMPAHPGLSPMLDEHMPDHPGHSPMLEVQSTTHHRLTIASLYRYAVRPDFGTCLSSIVCTRLQL